MNLNLNLNSPGIQRPPLLPIASQCEPPSCWPSVRRAHTEPAPGDNVSCQGAQQPTPKWSNDTSCHHSELTKNDFNELFNLLTSIRMPVFISGSIPALNRGVGCFSRILALSTWSACAYKNTAFIDNFSLF